MPKSVLEKLGFRRGWIYETVLTTQSRRGSMNSAPMGVWTSDMKSINIKAYKNSKTLENLLENNFFVINFPNCVQLFHDALSSKKPRYVKTKYGRAVPGLSFLEMKTTGSRKLKDAVEFNASVVGHKIKNKVRLFNRAEYLTIEYLIKKTKPNVNKKELLEYRRIVSKVAPNSVYSELVK